VRRILVSIAAAVVVVPLAGLVAAVPASAAPLSVVVAPNTAEPGDTVSVSAFFDASGWTPGGTFGVFLRIPTQASGPQLAAFSLASQPIWAAAPCTVNSTATLVACLWTPSSDTAQVQLDADLTVASTTGAQTIQVDAGSGYNPPTGPGVSLPTQSAPLLVTPAPTVTPTATPTPTGTATPTPTGTATPTVSPEPTATASPSTVPVPTAVPAGEGPARGGGAAPVLLLAAVIALVGGSAWALVRRRA
jgi:hypothetical protein